MLKRSLSEELVGEMPMFVECNLKEGLKEHGYCTGNNRK
jgi:hypothetical protein